MIRGTTRNANKKELDLNANIHNRFDIEVIDSKTGKIKQQAHAENIICDSIWPIILGRQSYFMYIHYGSGSGTPSSSDTSLFNFIGSGYAESLSYSVEPGILKQTKKIQLSETTAVGQTLTEVGIGQYTSASSLMTHAMLRDMNGNQISILKTDTDIINIYATVFVHWTCISGNTFISATAKAVNRNDVEAKGFLGALAGKNDEGFPTIACLSSTAGYKYGDPSTAVESGVMTTDVPNKRITITYPRFSADKGNSVQALAVMFGNRGTSATAVYAQVPHFLIIAGGTEIPPVSILNEAVGTGDGSTVDFKTKFSNLSQCEIFVNGSPASGVNADLNIPFVSGNGKAGLYPGIFKNGTFCYDLTDIPSSNMAENNYTYYPIGGCLFNYFHSSCGIATIDSNAKVSNDLVSWVDIPSGTVPTEYQNYKYWRKETDNTNINHNYLLLTRTRSSDNNIHFTTPPSVGDIITANYVTKTIPKDLDHVFDVAITIQLGEYTQ